MNISRVAQCFTYISSLRKKKTRITQIHTPKHEQNTICISGFGFKVVYTVGSFPNLIITWVTSIEPLRVISTIRPTNGSLAVSLFKRGFLSHLNTFNAAQYLIILKLGWMENQHYWKIKNGKTQNLITYICLTT